MAADDNPESEERADLISSLALLYLQHADPMRAVILGMCAMKQAAVTPNLSLLVATAFLKINKPEQALAVLSRFEDPESSKLSRAPTIEERVSAAILTARSYHRLKQPVEAKRALSFAQEHLEIIS